jgi:hypothetical protein
LSDYSLLSIAKRRIQKPKEISVKIIKLYQKNQ